jgi:hypothetical protein
MNKNLRLILTLITQTIPTSNLFEKFEVQYLKLL